MDYFNSDFKINGNGKIDRLINTANEIKKNINTRIKEQPVAKSTDSYDIEIQLREINNKITKAQSELTRQQMYYNALDEISNTIKQYPQKSAEVVARDINSSMRQIPNSNFQEFVPELKANNSRSECRICPRMSNRFVYVLSQVCSQPFNAFSSDNMIRINDLINISKVCDMPADDNRCSGQML